MPDQDIMVGYWKRVMTKPVNTSPGIDNRLRQELDRVWWLKNERALMSTRVLIGTIAAFNVFNMNTISLPSEGELDRRREEPPVNLGVHKFANSNTSLSLLPGIKWV